MFVSPITSFDFSQEKSRSGTLGSSGCPLYSAVLQNIQTNVVKFRLVVSYKIFFKGMNEAKIHINNYLFYLKSNIFGTAISNYFTKRTELPKRPLKSTQAFKGETMELK